MTDRLTVHADGRPRLLVSRECPNLILELEHLVYPPDARGDRDPSEKARQKDDHAADALRYLCAGLRKYGV